MGRLTEYLAKRQGKRQADGSSWLPRLAAERLVECGPDPDYVVAARDRAFASKERRAATPGSERRFGKGPLQAGYSEAGLTNRQRVAGRAVTTLLACKKLYGANDRIGFDKLVPKLDRYYGVLQDEPGSAPEFGPMLRARMFPRWCHE